MVELYLCTYYINLQKTWKLYAIYDIKYSNDSSKGVYLDTKNTRIKSKL